MQAFVGALVALDCAARLTGASYLSSALEANTPGAEAVHLATKQIHEALLMAGHRAAECETAMLGESTLGHDCCALCWMLVLIRVSISVKYSEQSAQTKLPAVTALQAKSHAHAGSGWPNQ